MTLDEPKKSVRDVMLGERVRLSDFVNLYECEVDDDSMIGAFVEIQRGAKVGKRCRVQSHSFLCDGVTLEDDVFIGHGVLFINDSHPSVEATLNKTWKMENVTVKTGASIGSGAIIMAGVTIGRKAVVGAGAVVTKDVKDGETVVGIPARTLMH